MTRQKVLFLLIIPLLIGLNAWKWWPNAADLPRHSTSEQPAETGDYDIGKIKLDIQIDEQAGIELSSRDLFYPKVEKRIIKKVIKRVIKKKPTQVGPSAFEVAVKEAQRVLSILNLIGISERDGVRKAFFTDGTDTYIVGFGESIKEIYTVGDITPDSVTFVVKKLKIKKTIYLKQ